MNGNKNGKSMWKTDYKPIGMEDSKVYINT